MKTQYERQIIDCNIHALTGDERGFEASTRELIPGTTGPRSRIACSNGATAQEALDELRTHLMNDYGMEPSSFKLRVAYQEFGDGRPAFRLSKV